MVLVLLLVEKGMLALLEPPNNRTYLTTMVHWTAARNETQRPGARTLIPGNAQGMIRSQEYCIA